MTGYVLSHVDFSTKDVLTVGTYAFTWRADLTGKSTVTVERCPNAEENDFFYCEKFFGVIETVKSVRGATAYTISLQQPEMMFADDAILSQTAEMMINYTGSTTGGYKQILDDNYVNTSDSYMRMPYLTVTSPDMNTPYGMCPEYDENRKFNIFDALSWARSSSYQWPQYIIYLQFTVGNGSLTVAVKARSATSYTPSSPSTSQIRPIDLQLPAFVSRAESYKMIAAAEAMIIYTNSDTGVSTTLSYYLTPDGTVTNNPSAQRLRGHRVIDTAEGTSQSAAAQRAKEILSDQFQQHQIVIKYDSSNPMYTFTPEDVGRRVAIKTALGLKYSTIDELTVKSNSDMIELKFGVLPTKLTDMIAANEKRIEKTAQSEGGGGGGGTQQVQSDWDENDTTAPAYIKNKPAVSDAGVFYIEGVNSVAAVTTSPYYAARWKGSHNDITSLYSGLTIIYKLDVAGHATYGTVLDINGLGEHPVTRNTTTMIGTSYAVGTSVILTYDEDISGTVYINSSSTSEVQGVWKVADYASTSNYQLRKNSGAVAVKSTAGSLYRYELCMTDLNGDLVPFNNVSNARTTYTKAMNSQAFDPFGFIYWYYTTTTVAAGSNAAATALYRQVAYDARYSLNLNSSGTAGTTSLTTSKPVYLRVLYDPATGTATFTQNVSSTSYLERSSITQALPSANPDASRTDGKKTLYIYLGHAYSKYQIELSADHPVYAWDPLHGEMRNVKASDPGHVLYSYTGMLATVNGVTTVPIDTTKFKITQLMISNADLNAGSLGSPKMFIFASASASAGVMYELGTQSTLATYTKADPAQITLTSDTTSIYYNNNAINVAVSYTAIN